MILRSPIFGNSQSFDSGQVVRHNLSGELQVAYDKSWPRIDKLKWEWTAINKKDKDNFVNFIIQTAAQEIRIVDFENNTWIGIISVDPLEITEVVINDGCHFNITFEFEGYMV